jgi:hypothetical protein
MNGEQITKHIVESEMKKNINELYEHSIFASYLVGHSLKSLKEDAFKENVLNQIRSEIGSIEDSDKKTIDCLAGLTLAHDLGKVENLNIWATNMNVNDVGYQKLKDHTTFGPNVIGMLKERINATSQYNESEVNHILGLLADINEFHHASNPLPKRRYPDCDLNKIPLYLQIIGGADRMAAGTINKLSNEAGSDNLRGYHLAKGVLKDSRQIQLETIIDIYKFTRDNRENSAQDISTYLTDQDLEGKTIENIHELEQKLNNIDINNHQFKTYISNQIKVYKIFSIPSIDQLNTLPNTEEIMNNQTSLIDFLFKGNIKILQKGLFDMMIASRRDPLPAAI